MGHQSKMSPGYQPTGQGSADNQFQNLAQTYGSVAQNLAQTAPNQYNSVYQNVVANPYYQQAQTGANDASQIGLNSVAPAQLGAASTLYGAGTSMGDWASQIQAAGGRGFVPRAQQDAGQLYGAIPQATAGYGLAMPAYQQGQANANQLYGLGLDFAGATIPGQISAADQVLNTGYDPQNALYDRSYQQLMEQTNAQAAQQGVNGSPFAAGVAGQNASNFNIDWQNNQLQRQIAALNAYSGAMTNATGNFNNTINGASNNYIGQTGNGSSIFNNMTNGATSNLNSLVTNADSMIQNAKLDEMSSQQQAIQNYLALQNGQMTAYGAASDLGAAGLNTMTTASMYPNEVYMNQQNQILQALNNMVAGTNQSLAPSATQQGLDLNYLKTGQNATQLAQNATSYNNQLEASQMSGIGQLAGLALAPFTGGMSMAGSFGGQMLGGAGNSLGGLSGIGAGLGLQPMTMLTAGA